ncbi:biotin/lipoate A/B protein ligase family protein [Terrilactibacillus sp. S3-3]|nr:biotin/lipoate A/B protein ligase family protein [Terrilactibacillus sp. S3-3]
MPSILHQPIWRVIDQTTLGSTFDGKQSFAIDDTLCHSVGSGDSPCTARMWVHDRTVMLGIQDTRLPHLEAALEVLEQAGYRYIARNSGGLAVVLDSGVLNLSLIFPEHDGKLTIDKAYQAMVDFIRKMLAPYSISFEAREIARSYCPGRYDLSVSGKKFAGISQRRIRRGVAVQIYLCISGSGAERARLIQHFYERGIQDEKTRFVYPNIDPNVMASLEEISGKPLTVQQMAGAFLQTLQSFGTVVSAPLSADEAERFNLYERMIRRNEKAFHFTRNGLD